MTRAPISQYQNELLARARARIAASQVRYGDKIAYPDNMQLVIDLVGQIESLTLALEMSEHSVAQPKYLSGCLLDGVCRGVCRNTDCPNYDLVVAARLVVEGRVEGIVYPDGEHL